MALTTIRNLLQHGIEVFNPTAGSASGSKVYITAPARGQLIEAGFMPAAAVTSNMTMRVQISQLLSSTSSVLTEVISSTLASFNSVMLIEGSCASANPPSPAYVNAGDGIQITTSGGNTSATGATIYAIFQRG
jgi:hypothetical protein